MEPVPKIEVDGSSVRSNAARPRNITDSCACWEAKQKLKAKTLLKTKANVVCEDATAYAAMLSMSIHLLSTGKTVKATLVQGWTR